MEEKTHKKGDYVQTFEALLLVSLVVYVFYGGYILAQTTVDSDVGCQTITHTNMVPSKYGSPLNLFSSTKEQMMKVICVDKKTAVVHVGNGKSTQYIYKYGHNKVNGSWQKIKYTGANIQGPWIVGSATAEIEGVEGDEKGKVLAYICQKEGGKWRCGCGDTNCRNAKWQIQEYSEEESNTTTNDTVGDGELDVYAPSTYHVLPGEKVTLTGIGFDNPIDVLWNGEIKDNNLESRNKTTITTTVPNLPPGKYDIKVREGNTVSEYGTVIWIKTYGETQEPHITSITPSSGKQGDTFTIHGYGFTKENNDILTMFQEYEKVVSKNGTEMKFLFKPFEKDWKQYNESGERVSRQIPVQVTVVNTGGVSNYATFNLEL